MRQGTAKSVCTFFVQATRAGATGEVGNAPLWVEGIEPDKLICLLRALCFLLQQRRNILIVLEIAGHDISAARMSGGLERSKRA
jgi:hypothetical protein